MRTLVAMAAVFGLLAMPVFGLIQDAEKEKVEKQDAGPSTEQVLELIKQLGADEFKVREEAQTKLVKHGKKVLEQLKAAREKTEDAEIQTRLDEIIKKIQAPKKKARDTELEKERENPFGRDGIFRIQRGFRIGGKKADPKKQLEKITKYVEKMQKILKDEDLTDEQKVQRLSGYAGRIQSEAMGGGASGIQIRQIGPNGFKFEWPPKGDDEEADKEMEKRMKEEEEQLRQMEKDLRDRMERQQAEIQKFIDRLLKDLEGQAPAPRKENKEND